jgi:putative DNA primase/helicase
LERIRDALQFIDASDRKTWVEMGMAIHAEFGDAGFDLWTNGASKPKTTRHHRRVTCGGAFDLAEGRTSVRLSTKPRRTAGSMMAATRNRPRRACRRRRIALGRAAKEEAEIARERADTALKAAAILKAATEAKADHPYLARKRVSPVATLREIDAGAVVAILGYAPKSGGVLLAGRLLVVPVKQGNRISTLELIDGDKHKTALAGRGSKAGGYWASKRLPDGNGNGLTLLIGEGVATVLSAKEATGHPAVAALSSGNLPAVAKTMRERYPKAVIVILADLVKATGAPDPHAIEAVRAVGGRLAIPDLGTDRDPDMTDMNDLFILGGAEAVAQAIANANAPKAEIQAGEGIRQWSNMRGMLI